MVTVYPQCIAGMMIILDSAHMGKTCPFETKSLTASPCANFQRSIHAPIICETDDMKVTPSSHIRTFVLFILIPSSDSTHAPIGHHIRNSTAFMQNYTTVSSRSAIQPNKAKKDRFEFALKYHGHLPVRQMLALPKPNIVWTPPTQQLEFSKDSDNDGWPS